MSRQARILHVCVLDKFIPSFIRFVRANFDASHHRFVLIGDMTQHPLAVDDAMLVNDLSARRSLSERLRFKLGFLAELNRSDRIILHGLFLHSVNLALFLQPWLLGKAYWFIWGGDLYRGTQAQRDWRWHYEEFFRRPIIRRLGHLVSYIDGDIERARQWYGARGAYCRCLLYPSNLYKAPPVLARPHRGLNILAGNSADPSNDHAAIFARLQPLRYRDVRIFAPLSYGDPSYAQDIAAAGSRIFGEKFVPLLDFMAAADYYDFLADIDVAIFAHRRQQAMGNIITLLGMGKRVVLRSGLAHSNALRELSLHVDDFDSFDADVWPAEYGPQNQAIVREVFSEQTLTGQLREIFA